jgi:hypothetical protein
LWHHHAEQTLNPGDTRAMYIHCASVPTAFGYSLQPCAHGLAGSSRHIEVAGGPQWFGPRPFHDTRGNDCVGLVGCVEYELLPEVLLKRAQAGGAAGERGEDEGADY